MSEEQLKTVREEIIKAVGMTVPPSIEKVVNGHIRALSAKLDDHIVEHKNDIAEVKGFMDEMRPVIQGAKGVKLLGEGLKWFSGIAAAYLIFKGIWK